MVFLATEAFLFFYPSALLRKVEAELFVSGDAASVDEGYLQVAYSLIPLPYYWSGLTLIDFD